MRRLLLPVLLLAGCAGGGAPDTLSRSASFRARTAAIAATRGARDKGGEISRELIARLESGGLAASALDESDTVLAGSKVGLESMNPRLLDEIRGATGADAVVFLALDAEWSLLEISAVDARTGDAVVRSKARPRGPAFSGPAEIADASARALLPLAAARRAPRATRPDEPAEELPLPGN